MKFKTQCVTLLTGILLSTLFSSGCRNNSGAAQKASSDSHGLEYFLGIAFLLPCAVMCIWLLLVLILKRKPQRHIKTTTAGVLTVIAWAIPAVPLISMMIFDNDSAKVEQKSSSSGGAFCCSGPDLSGLDIVVEVGLTVVLMASCSVFTLILSGLAVKFDAAGRRAVSDGAGASLIHTFSWISLTWSIFWFAVLTLLTALTLFAV